ncbi:MAG: M48 family metallopeptidase [Flavobacteriales bacterium]|nr:M48 family metallopeptidase [Flavobacteriales bacterium]
MKRHLLLSLALLVASVLRAQDMGGHRPLQSENPIPLEFRQLSSEKYRNSQSRLDRERDGRQKTRDKDEFLLESNFMMSQLLTSGKVLFNDPVSVYLSKVLDRVLADDPELRQRVRVFALRSAVVNAFTTDDGIVLVSLGMLAQLENEAQLAFILSHELVHFERNHIINAHVRSVDIREGRGRHGQSSMEEQLLAQSHYSKELEKEADRDGLHRFLRTGYDVASLSGVFDVMRYAHLPFDDVPFDRDFFNHGHFRVDGTFFLDKVRSPEPLDGKETADASHPGPSERQAVLRKLIPQGHPSGQRFIVSEVDFLKLRETARYELTRLYMAANRPIMAVYNAFLLLRRHPDDRFLKEQVARAVYTLAKFKMAGKFGHVHPGWSAIEGESQQLYHLFYRMQADELAVLAIGHIWRLRLDHPDDADLIAMSEDLLHQFMIDHYVPGMIGQTAPVADTAQQDTAQNGQLSKYDRLRQKRMEDPRFAMMRLAFVDLFDDTTFNAQFDRWERERWMGPANGPTQYELEKQQREEQRRWKNTGRALGIDSVVMVTPAYAKMDLRKRQKHRFLDAESAKVKLHERIGRNASLLAMNTQILESTMLDSMGAQTFNDIAFLNEWVDQRLLQMDVDMVSLDRSALDGIMQRYGAHHFAWTGLINYRENKPLMYFYLLYALVPPAIPLAIYYLVRPNYDTYFYCLTFDLRTGEPAMIAYSNFRLKDAQDIVNSNLYDAMWQMKRRPRKEK